MVANLKGGGNQLPRGGECPPPRPPKRSPANPMHARMPCICIIMQFGHNMLLINFPYAYKASCVQEHKFSPNSTDSLHL